MEHIRVGTELIEKIQDLIEGYNEGYITVYLQDGKLNAYWTLSNREVQIDQDESYAQAIEKVVCTFDLREKPFEQEHIVQSILVKVNLGEKA